MGVNPAIRFTLTNAVKGEICPLEPLATAAPGGQTLGSSDPAIQRSNMTEAVSKYFFTAASRKLHQIACAGTQVGGRWGLPAAPASRCVSTPVSRACVPRDRSHDARGVEKVRRDKPSRFDKSGALRLVGRAEDVKRHTPARPDWSSTICCCRDRMPHNVAMPHSASGPANTRKAPNRDPLRPVLWRGAPLATAKIPRPSMIHNGVRLMFQREVVQSIA
jgi:hypothetical protein